MVPASIGRHIRPAAPPGMVLVQECSGRYWAEQARRRRRSPPSGTPLQSSRRRRALFVPAALARLPGKDELPQVKWNDGGR